MFASKQYLVHLHSPQRSRFRASTHPNLFSWDLFRTKRDVRHSSRVSTTQSVRLSCMNLHIASLNSLKSVKNFLRPIVKLSSRVSSRRYLKKWYAGLQQNFGSILN